jgi:plastocyanin
MNTFLNHCMKSFFATCLLITFVVLVSACMAMNKKKVDTASHGPGIVWMKADRFSPGVLTIKVNTTVTWTNKDLWAHTVTADNGLFKSGKLGSGDTWSYTFNKAGEYPYHCDIHSHMKGKVVVQ